MFERTCGDLEKLVAYGVYIGTASPYGMQGFLVYLYPESAKGYGTVVVATHAKFDLNFHPCHSVSARTSRLPVVTPDPRLRL